MSTNPATATLAAQFTHFANTQIQGSQLYRALCEGIAQDAFILKLFEHARATQQSPTLLLAIVHDALLAGANHLLANMYPTVALTRGLAHTKPSTAELHAAFHDFCTRYQDSIAVALTSRATQTNEIGRAAALRLAVAELYREHIPSIALVELGASAGLNLWFDRCRIRYARTSTKSGAEARDGATAGANAGAEQGTYYGPSEAGAALTIDCEVRGERWIPDASQVPMVHTRAGLDQNPINVQDETEARWLLACVWADEVQRFQRQAQALVMARAKHLTVERGTLPQDAAAFLARQRADAHLCIVTTWVLAYLTEAERVQLAQVVRDVGKSRDLSWIVAEAPAALEGEASASFVSPSSTALVLRSYRGGVYTTRVLAEMHGHGSWIRWI
jgi:hypothetical protein